MNIKIIYSIIIVILFITGIFLLTLTEIFSEGWLTGLVLIGILITMSIILTIKKFK